MGASGSAWIKPKKRSGLRSDAITNAPHPTAVRTGQRYFPLNERLASRVPIRVSRIRAGICEARREDVAGGIVSVKAERLLSVDAEGQGRYYRFIGYASRTYTTHVYVLDVEPPWAQLVCPEWHPEIPITIAAGALPATLNAPGSWLACRADLGADAPARLSPHLLGPPAPGFVAGRLPAVAIGDRGRPTADEPAPPADGRGCGDIVIFVEEDQLAETSKHLTGHPPPVEPGARVYVCAGGSVQGWRTLRELRPTPGGTRLRLHESWHAVTVPAQPVAPTSGMRDGMQGHQPWAWRSWPRADERT